MYTEQAAKRLGSNLREFSVILMLVSFQEYYIYTCLDRLTYVPLILIIWAPLVFFSISGGLVLSISLSNILLHAATQRMDSRLFNDIPQTIASTVHQVCVLMV